MSKRAALLDLAKEQGKSSRAVGQILNLLGAHPDLIDLPRVSYQLLQVLGVSSIGVPISFERCDEVVWREACQWLVSLARQPDTCQLRGDLYRSVVVQGLHQLDHLCVHEHCDRGRRRTAGSLCLLTVSLPR